MPQNKPHGCAYFWGFGPKEDSKKFVVRFRFYWRPPERFHFTWGVWKITFFNLKLYAWWFTIHWVWRVQISIQEVYNSTGGIQISIQGVYNSPGGIKMSFLGGYHSTGGIQSSFLGVYNSTGGIQISFLGVYNSTGGIQISFL